MNTIRPARRLDPLSPTERSERMSRVRGKNTKPELFVRRLAWSLGFRGYRLHVQELPGCPDLVFTRAKKVVFVHGCFWHRHIGCSACRMPKTRLEFWKPKLYENRRRDIANLRRLRKLGWKALIVWECEICDARLLVQALSAFLGKVR